MRTIQRIIVSALIFSKDSKILMGKKDPKKGGVYADCWHLPGGGINENESKIQALIREIKEEVGIDITRVKIELIDDQGKGESKKILETGEKVLAKMDFYVYKVTISDKDSNEIEVKLNDDLVEYKWVDLTETSRIQLTPPSIVLFKRLSYLQ